jgi:hypothetical protein
MKSDSMVVALVMGHGHGGRTRKTAEKILLLKFALCFQIWKELFKITNTTYN